MGNNLTKKELFKLADDTLLLASVLPFTSRLQPYGIIPKQLCIHQST